MKITHCILLRLITGIVLLLPAHAAFGQQSETAQKIETHVYKQSAGENRHLEIHFPPGHDPARSKTPGMILFHGGGWKSGSLSQFRAACAYFASRGVVAATAEYQMLDDAGRTALPEGESYKTVCVTDAKSAIRWFAAHAGELGIDPERLIVGGGSAGAHISTLATMNPGLADPADPSDSDPSVAAYVWFNPAFQASDFKHPEINILNHQRADMPPTVVFFGDQDTNWLPGWKTAYAKWKELGADEIEFWIAPGEKHGFFTAANWRGITLRTTDEFLVKNGLLSGESSLPKVPEGALLQMP